jgi:hypothetical protein
MHVNAHAHILSLPQIGKPSLSQYHDPTPLQFKVPQSSRHEPASAPPYTPPYAPPFGVHKVVMLWNTHLFDDSGFLAGEAVCGSRRARDLRPLHGPDRGLGPRGLDCGGGNQTPISYRGADRQRHITRKDAARPRGRTIERRAGATLQRHDLRKLLADCRAGKIGTVIGDCPIARHPACRFA